MSGRVANLAPVVISSDSRFGGGAVRIRLAMLVTALVAIGAAPAAGAVGHAHHPLILGKRIVGYSVRHRPIVAYHLGDPSIHRVSLVLGQMHGDEPAGITVVKALLHSDRRIVGVNLWVIPTMNPDGNAADTRQNAHGVDLNRNWPYRWAHLSGQYDSGPHALSEPESRAMHRFLLHLRPHYFVSLHQPLHAVDTSYGPRADRRWARTLANDLGLPHAPLRCWSTCHGSMTNWYVHNRYGLAETVEFGWHPGHTRLVKAVPRGILHALGGHFGHRVGG
jgi:succinylglutamate desuccinylase